VPDLIAAHGSLFATSLAPHQEIKWSAFRATDYHSRSKAFADQLGVGFGFQTPYMGLTDFAKSLPFSAATGSRVALSQFVHAHEFVCSAVAQATPHPIAVWIDAPRWSDGDELAEALPRNIESGDHGVCVRMGSERVLSRLRSARLPSANAQAAAEASQRLFLGCFKVVNATCIGRHKNAKPQLPFHDQAGVLSIGDASSYQPRLGPSSCGAAKDECGDIIFAGSTIPCLGSNATRTINRSEP
jgi:hypothetical protein